MNKLSNCSTPSPVSKSPKSLWVTVPNPKPSSSRGDHLVLGLCTSNPALQVPFLWLQVSAKASTFLPSLSVAPRQTKFPASYGFQEENCTSTASIQVSGLGTLYICPCAYRHIHFQLLSLSQIHFEKFSLKLMLSRAAYTLQY